MKRYSNPRLAHGIEYVMNQTASMKEFGQRNTGFVWYEPEFGMCKTKAFRKLYEARAWEIARRVRAEKGYDLEIDISWTKSGELLIMTKKIVTS